MLQIIVARHMGVQCLSIGWISGHASSSSSHKLAEAVPSDAAWTQLASLLRAQI